MVEALLHPNESARIESLNFLNILDTLPEKDFDNITFLASQICETPIALISLVDQKRQWFKAKVGLKATETERSIAFCAHAILQTDVFLVKDPSKDKRFFDNPLVTGDVNVQFYAGAPLLSPDGNPIGTLCVIDNKTRDLSIGQIESLKALSHQVTRLLELKVRIRELENSKLKLIESSRLSILGEMSAGIAHEINNPLAIISGRVEVTKMILEDEKALTPIVEKQINEISKTIDRIAKIIRGLRAFARDASADEYELIQSDEIINQTLDLCVERLKEAQIDLRLKLDKNASIECNGIQISQILLNLISNSFDAIKDQKVKWIEINFDEKEGIAQFTVTDSGNGINPTFVEKIMNPFFTTKEVGKGTGLGLSIAAGLASSHGGELKYDRTCINTRFILRIPIKK